jgi:hypothetical protein
MFLRVDAGLTLNCRLNSFTIRQNNPVALPSVDLRNEERLPVAVRRLPIRVNLRARMSSSRRD